MKTGGWFCCGRRKLVVVFVLYQHNDTELSQLIHMQVSFGEIQALNGRQEY